MHEVDVMLPYYGDVELMKQSVRSVLAQAFPDWKLTVLDDGYPSPEPAAWFAGLGDPRVQYLRNRTNLGANGNYRQALDLARAPVVVLMGADDIMLPQYLNVVIRALKDHPEAAVVQPAVTVIDGEGNVWLPLPDRVKRWMTPGGRAVRELRGEGLAAGLLHGGWHYFPALAWRTPVVRRIGFRPEYDVVQDLALLLDIVAEGGSVVLTPDPVFQYRRHAASDSSVRAVDGRRFDEERRFFAAEADRFSRQGWARAARAARLHWTSRLHALLTLIRAGRKAPPASLARLARHVVA